MDGIANNPIRSLVLESALLTRDTTNIADSPPTLRNIPAGETSTG
jgi:hypothetical protein